MEISRLEPRGTLGDGLEAGTRPSGRQTLARGGSIPLTAPHFRASLLMLAAGLVRREDSFERTRRK
jgi:hypothetical protein